MQYIVIVKFYILICFQYEININDLANNPLVSQARLKLKDI